MCCNWMIIVCILTDAIRQRYIDQLTTLGIDKCPYEITTTEWTVDSVTIQDGVNNVTITQCHLMYFKSVLQLLSVIKQTANVVRTYTAMQKSHILFREMYLKTENHLTFFPRQSEQPSTVHHH